MQQGPQRGLSADESRAAQGIGRSRGGLTTKVHLLGDGWGRALVRCVTAGQSANTKELVALLDAVQVPRPGGHGRPRKRLEHLTADRAYGSKANRRSLGARGIPHTIPERSDVQASRARKDRRVDGPRPSMPPDTRTATASNGHRCRCERERGCRRRQDGARGLRPVRRLAVGRDLGFQVRVCKKFGVTPDQGDAPDDRDERGRRGYCRGG
ncbi:transposase [Dactylosporangium sp. CA-139114]|uniref:transposase n=1 Tax=Dactylosporangium sp. CA-139114 TaxID=3239931 RepID=UPI003D955A71